jgi:hypothetical protein
MPPKGRPVGEWRWDPPVAEIGPLGRLGYGLAPALAEQVLDAITT